MDPALRRLALAPLLLGFTGPVPPRWLLDALADGLGGVVLFASNLTGDPAALTASLREAAERDVVVALDEEGGDVTRLDAATGSSSPGAAALGWYDDTAVTRDAYRGIGQRLLAAGVTVDLAPVADVNTDPRNPVIGLRSFADDPHRAARHVAAAVEGLQGTGIAACVKHFPGHGATVDDSHHGVATVTADRAELEAVELLPFRAAVAAGTRAVMTGHLAVPALDPLHLATVSRRITTDLLRGELGFTGTVVTDALEMKAVADTIGMVEGYLGALGAGADAVETGAAEHPGFIDAVVAAVAAALTGGRLTEERLRDAGRRTADLARPGVAQAAAPAGPGVPVEVVGEVPAVVDPLVLECRPPDGVASGALPWSFGDQLARRVGPVEVRTVTGEEPVPLARGRTTVVVVRDPVRHPWQRDLVERARSTGEVVVVDVGWPGPVVTGVPTIRTRGVAPGLLAAAAAVLSWEEVRGR